MNAEQLQSKNIDKIRLYNIRYSVPPLEYAKGALAQGPALWLGPLANLIK